ncbi:MAG: ANTAR domain-containing protein [Lachnospiraceae bacterium]|nr:ANTAR domain-containing protein [Lachnospiraceae bacterium]MBP5183496.1 ANTAR domain-containing protein [Lachnospiraceae bacterium]
MSNVLIAMPKHEDADRISEMLKKGDLSADTIICRSAAETLGVASGLPGGVVICMKNLPDMNFAETFECLPRGFNMIVITGDTSLEFSSERMRKVPIPFKMTELLTAVESFLRLRPDPGQNLRRKHRSAAEQQEIDVAKHRLMKAKGMTEPEAYRYIQKYSMDAGRSLVESARMVLALIEHYGE